MEAVRGSSRPVRALWARALRIRASFRRDTRVVSQDSPRGMGACRTEHRRPCRLLRAARSHGPPARPTEDLMHTPELVSTGIHSAINIAFAVLCIALARRVGVLGSLGLILFVPLDLAQTVGFA